MPVLEMTQLRLKRLAADDPALLRSLATVRAKLHTNSQFYNSVQDTTIIYILGIWPSLDAHLEFLASPERDEILGPQEDMLQFCWTIHVEIGGDMSSLPLDAPILAIERVRVQEKITSAFERSMKGHMQELQGSHQCKAVHGWRCDTTSESHEALIFSGWSAVQAHVNFATKNSCDEQFEMVQTIHARNLEQK